MLTSLLVIVAMVALQALYVGAEFATVAARPTRIAALAARGDRAAQKLLPHLEDARALDRYVAACQIGITFSTLVLGAFGQARLGPLLAPRLSAMFGIGEAAALTVSAVAILLVLTGLQVVAGELVPKAFAIRYPERMALALAVPMRISLWLYTWFIVVMNGTGNLVLRLLGVPSHGHRHVHSPEELERLISRGEAALNPEGRQRLEGVFKLARRDLQDVMVPRTRAAMLDLERPLAETLRVPVQQTFSRFPLVRGDLDDIVGVVHVKDLLLALEAGTPDLESLARPVPTLPHTLAADEALERLRHEASPMALVLDEYGGSMGLVTLEDLMEEVLGEVHDEFDPGSGPLQKVGDAWIVRGDHSLQDFEEVLGVQFGLSEVVRTPGGLVQHLLGRPARTGESVTAAGRRFTVLEVAGNRIVKLRVEVAHG